MPTVHLKARDIVLAYEDSGVPSGSTDYTTVFLIHPFLFNARAFQKVFPYGAPNNLRFIAPHMREYDQSTPYSDEELDLFHSSDVEEQEASLRLQALELADLIVHFIENEPLPAPSNSDGARVGGVHIVGWSAGSAQVFSLLANISALDKPVSDLLEKYVGTVILADASSMCYGIPEPTKIYHPFRDTYLTHDGIYPALLTFISTYFEPIDDLASVTVPYLQKRKPIAEVSPDAEFTVTKFPPEEFADVTDYNAIDRVGPGMVDWMVYAENVRRALLDTQGQWKDVKAVLTWGNMSFWPTSWGVKGIAELLEVPPEAGLQRRDIRIVKMEGGNHLFFWDKPKEAVKLILENIR